MVTYRANKLPVIFATLRVELERRFPSLAQGFENLARAEEAAVKCKCPRFESKQSL